MGDSAFCILPKPMASLKSPTHTLAAELIAKHGPESAKDMPEHYAHTRRDVGQDIDSDVDVDQVEVSSGDKILICSDGVTNMVDLKKLKNCAKLLSPRI